MNTQSYDCHRKPDGCDDELMPEIGDFSWRYYQSGELGGISIRLPTVDGSEITWIPVGNAGPGPNWDFNTAAPKDLDRPTLVPSILFRKDQWHGHMTAGRLVSC